MKLVKLTQLLDIISCRKRFAKKKKCLKIENDLETKSLFLQTNV